MKTDTQLQQDIVAELKWEPAINADNIGVIVNDGVVTLNGRVDSFSEKWDAERIVKNIAGVTTLAIEMDVALPTSCQRYDADLAQSVRNVLEWTNYLPKDGIQVMVENGWVTLTGEVEWKYQKRRAAEAVRYLFGVVGISDQITLVELASSSSIKEGIEAAIVRHAKTDAAAITVDVNGSEVSLHGKVHSYYERALVSNSAWGAAGVQKVNNHVTVSY